MQDSIVKSKNYTFHLETNRGGKDMDRPVSAQDSNHGVLTRSTVHMSRNKSSKGVNHARNASLRQGATTPSAFFILRDLINPIPGNRPPLQRRRYQTLAISRNSSSRSGGACVGTWAPSPAGAPCTGGSCFFEKDTSCDSRRGASWTSYDPS